MAGHSRYREYVETGCILCEHGTTIVCHRLPCCGHRSLFYIGCDPAGGVAWQEGHNHHDHSLDPLTKNGHSARDNVGRYTQGNLRGMLL